MSAKKKHNTNVGGSPALRQVMECGSGKAGRPRSDNGPAAGATPPPVAISERVSLPKRGVGRPRKFSEENVGLLLAYNRTITTERGIQNRSYAVKAINTLRDLGGGFKQYPWIRPGAVKGRWTVLAELGRLDDPKRIVAFAKMIEASPPGSATQAQQIIRQARRTKYLRPGAFNLANAFREVTKAFRAANPDFQLWDIRQAVQMFWSGLPLKARKDPYTGDTSIA